MTTVLLRRRGLGKTSCKKIVEKCQEDIVVVRNDLGGFPEDTSLVIRWGCTGNVPTQNVLNSARGIHTVANKAEFRRLLSREAPNIVPATVFEYMPFDMEGSWVVRPSTHSQGRHVYLVDGYNKEEFMEATEKCGPGWYASEYIPKIAEYRVLVIQGRVAWIANKIPADPDAVAWNVALGGRFENVRWGNWPMKVVEVALEAWKHTGLHFSGIDVMVAPDGSPLVLEANSAPSLTSDYRQTCMAKCFDWIIRNGKEPIPPFPDRGWRGVVHPAISGDAYVS